MSEKNSSEKARNIVLVSTDGELINLARGAIASGDKETLTIIQKPIGEVISSVRDMDAQILVLDMDASVVAEFEHLQKIKRMAPKNTPIIVISHAFSPAAARIFIQLKVADFLVKPVQTSDLVRACNNSVKANTEEAQVDPQFLCFMPASGGVGTTTVALEAASILNTHGQKLGRSTCVVDLNFQHGSCAEYLDIEPRFDISEIENAPERLDRQLLDVMLSKHQSGLSVISAPNQPSEMRTFKPALVVRLLDLVSAYFDNVVIDLPRIWFPWTQTVVAGSDRLFLVADMTVPSIRHSKRLIEAIEEKIGKQSAPQVIVNRMDMRNNNPAGLNAKDVEDALEGYFAGGIPNNYGLVRSAVDRGMTLQAIESNNNVTEALSGIILENEEQNEIRSINEKAGGLLSIGKQLFKRKAG